MSRLVHLAFTPPAAADYSEQPSQKGWINYGNDNLFPQYLVDLYHSSPTHTALVNSIATMIYGQGFYPVDLDSRLRWVSWDMDSELRKACIDLKIQGGFALEIMWGKDGIDNVTHFPFENWRAAESVDGEDASGYWYSPDWSKNNIEPQFVASFNPSEAIAGQRQVMYVKPFSPGSYYYPKPDYLGALNYIELEREIGKFHLNNINNGLAPSFAIHFKNGAADPEERASIRREIEDQMSGSKGAGKVWITYSDLPELTPEFTPIQLSDAHNQYQFLSTECTDKIMIGHRVTSPMLFGVMVPGRLGGGQEMVESKTIFDENVVQPYRKIVAESVKAILQAAGLDDRLELALASVDESQHLATAWQELSACGEQMGDEWELIDARPVEYDLEPELDALLEPKETLMSKVMRKIRLADVLETSTGKSEQDNTLFRVRYAYAPNTYQNDSRAFCKQMIDAGLVYRKEDIIRAGSQSVNPGFGPNGVDTYSIWFYKGGARCHHFWERRTYMKRTNDPLSVNEARRLINKMPANVRDKYRFPINDPKVAKRPVDMPNQGFLKPRR